MSSPWDLKVLHFTTTVGGGGAERMLCNMVEQMHGHGVRNVVVSTTSSLDDSSQRGKIEKVATFYDLEVSSLLKPVMWRKFWRILRKERPQVVHTWMHTAGIVAGIIARLAGVKTVVWGIHSLDLLCDHAKPCRRCALEGKLLGFFARFVPRKIISCSHVGLLNHCREMGYPAQKMIWIGNGIDMERFQPRPEKRAAWRAKLGIPENAPVIGMVTRMNPVKDVPTFLRAAVKLQAIRPDVHIAVCGLEPSILDAETAACAQALPDPSRVHWLGYQGEPENVYPLFDIHTLTSVSEAFPMVLIEAMACGVPSVSTNVGDAAAILSETGKIVPTRDPEAVVEAWLSLLSTDLRDACRQDALARFGLESCAVRYRDVYQLAA